MRELRSMRKGGKIVYSPMFMIEGGYSWNPNNAKRLFRVYSEKKTDSGRIEITDRFGNVYSARVSW